MKNDSAYTLGHRLRTFREERGLRIVDISNMTGLAVSTISKVENDRMSLTYDKLLQLAKGLGVDLTDLFGNLPQQAPRGAVTARRSVGSMEKATHISAGHYDYWYLNTDLAIKNMTPIIGETKARSLKEFGELIRHPGQEFLFVLEGAVIVETEFYSPVTLKSGETLYIDSEMGHAYLAGDAGRCRFLVVCAGADSDELMTAIGSNRKTVTVGRTWPAGAERRPKASARPASAKRRVRR